MAICASGEVLALEDKMPEVYLLLIGASAAAPLLLFTILAWNAVERGVELAETEGRVRLRTPSVRRGAAIPLVVLAGGNARAMRQR
jgi:hypothetical protein